jgi:molybdopterin converting factor small subunit
VLLEPGDAERPTPCSGWRARELIDHAVGVVELVGNLVGTPIAEGATVSIVPAVAGG